MDTLLNFYNDCVKNYYFSIYALAGFIAVCFLLWNLSRTISYLQTCWEQVTVCTYYLCYGVTWAIQKITWAYNGVQDHLVMAEYGGLYDTCVHVQGIIHRGRFSIMNHPRPWDFIGVHEGFAHPHTLLNPKISLYCLTPTHAYFLESPEEVDVHHSRTNPFMYMAQYFHAVRVYTIPLGHFHRLADEVGNPRVPVIWIASTGRCGSTLVGQMLEKLPGTRCLSEPDCLTNISLMARANQMGSEDINKLIRSAVRILCKDSPGVQRIVFKPRFNSITELEAVMESFPEFKYIYVYRNLGSVLKSYYKFMHRDTAMCMLEWLYNNKLISYTVPFVRKYLIHFIAGDESKHRVAGLLPNTDFMGIVAAIICSCIVEFQAMSSQRGILIPTLHYDELMKNPLEVTSKLFELFELPAQYVQMSLVAMQHDTQQGTILSNISNSTQNLKKITGKDIKDMNMVLQALGLPDMNHEMCLPNSLVV